MYELNKEEFLKKLNELESDYFDDIEYGKQIRLGEYCKKKLKKSEELRKSTDALTPILKTALVINWPEEHMKRRVKRLNSLFPEIDSLNKMKNLITTTDPSSFCKLYLDINSTYEKAAYNPKFRLLRELTFGFLDYMKLNKAKTEIEALRHWASQVNPKSLKNDYIGKRYGVGPGVVENIRLNLGIDTIKPDRHVIGVLEQIFGFNEIEYEDLLPLAEAVGIKKYYIDKVLFIYGKKNKISSKRVKSCN